MLFLLTCLSSLPSRKGVENKHNYDEWGGFVLINRQILKTDRNKIAAVSKENITC